MMFKIYFIKALSVLIALLAIMTTALADVNVAYFKEWAAPYQVAKVAKTYDEALGQSVNWVAFDSSEKLTEAMISGDIDIAISQGLAPFINAVNAQVPIKLVGVAVAYGDNNDCVIREDSGINKTNARKLEGKSVALPVNTMADYGFRLSMKHLGVNQSKIKIIDLNSSDAAASLIKGAVVMACGFGNSLSQMKVVGKSLLTIEEKKAAGITNIDVVSVTDVFAKKEPDLLRAFMEITAEANEDYEDDPEASIKIIAEDAGLSIEKAQEQLAGFAFPTVEEQLNCYLNEEDGRALAMLPFMGKLFATKSAPARKNYNEVVDISFLED